MLRSSWVGRGQVLISIIYGYDQQQCRKRQTTPLECLQQLVNGRNTQSLVRAGLDHYLLSTHNHGCLLVYLEWQTIERVIDIGKVNGKRVMIDCCGCAALLCLRFGDSFILPHNFCPTGYPLSVFLARYILLDSSKRYWFYQYILQQQPRYVFLPQGRVYWSLQYALWDDCAKYWI